MAIEIHYVLTLSFKNINKFDAYSIFKFSLCNFLFNFSLYNHSSMLDGADVIFKQTKLLTLMLEF